MLVIKDLNKKFVKKTVLDRLSVTVKPGEVAVFVGPSGVGKSTLLRVLAHLEKPDSGSISIDGTAIDVHSAHPSHLIGMVFQGFNLFEHLTVERNITLALEKVLGMSSKDAVARAINLLESFGLGDKAHMPISSLSGGQKQRLAIVRALAMKPQVLCLDEPTSALDPMLTGFVAQQIQELAQQGYHVLVTTHDKSLVEKLNAHMYLMSEGRIIESANTQELKAEPDRFPKLKAFLSGAVLASNQ